MPTRYAARMRGFTLIELMIVVTIVAILAGAAMFAYRSYVLKAARTDAKNGLYIAAQSMERCYSQYFSYLGNPSGTPAVSCPVPSTAFASPNGTYSILESNLTATTYTLTATPVSGGQASGDTKCHSFSLDQSGAQTALTETRVDNSNYCWLGHN